MFRNIRSAEGHIFEEHRKMVAAYHSIIENIIDVLKAEQGASLEIRNYFQKVYKILLFVAACSGIAAVTGLMRLLIQIFYSLHQ